jgi:hypothetical protein
MSGDRRGVATEEGPERNEDGASRSERRNSMDPLTPAGGSDTTTPDDLRPAPRLAIEPGVLLSEAWTIFSAAWPACLVVYWGTVAAWWLIINLLVIFLAALNVAIADPAVTPFLEFLRFLGFFLVPAWLWLGQGIAFLKIARRQPVEQQDLFRGGPYLLTALLAFGTFLAITAVPCLIAYASIEALLALGGADSLVATVRRLLPERTPADVAALESWLLVVLALTMAVVGLWYAAFFAVRVRLRTVPYLIIDRRAGVLESMRTSMQLTRGRVASLFLVHLAQFTINLAGLLVCCLGLFVTLPLTSLISAVIYNALAVDLPPIEPSGQGLADEDDATG